MSSDQPRRGRDTAASAGSPMGSTAAIVIAIVAVVAGFLILRQIRSDDSGTTATLPASSTTIPLDTSASSTVAPGTTLPLVTTTTQFVPVIDGATVVVANASTVNGAAGVLTTALQGKGYTTEKATNATVRQDATTILYDVTNTNALPVAESLAVLLGGPIVQEVPSPAPIEGGVLPGGASIIVMLGSDRANKTLEQMGAPTTTVAGAATSLPAVGGETTTTVGG